MDTVAMNSSVWHPIARARGLKLALCDAILIKLMQNPKVTFASMQGHAGMLRLWKRPMKLENSVVFMLVSQKLKISLMDQLQCCLKGRGRTR